MEEAEEIKVYYPGNEREILMKKKKSYIISVHFFDWPHKNNPKFYINKTYSYSYDKTLLFNWSFYNLKWI